jgi:hypothetical protein
MDDPLRGTLPVDVGGVAGGGTSSVVHRVDPTYGLQLDRQEQRTGKEEEEVFSYPTSPASQLHDLPTSRSDSPHPALTSHSPTSSSTPTQASFPSILPGPSLAPIPLTMSPDIKPLLISAIQAGELYKLERLFSSHPDSAFSLANEPLNRHTQITPLHAASTHGHLPIVRFLVDECGAILEMEDSEGEVSFRLSRLVLVQPLLSSATPFYLRRLCTRPLCAVISASSRSWSKTRVSILTSAITAPLRLFIMPAREVSWTSSASVYVTLSFFPSVSLSRC